MMRAFAPTEPATFPTQREPRGFQPIKNPRVQVRLRGVSTNLYVTAEGRVRLAGDLLDITDRLNADEIQRCKWARDRAILRARTYGLERT